MTEIKLACQICENNTIKDFDLYHYYPSKLKKIIKFILCKLFSFIFLKLKMINFIRQMNILIGEDLFLFKKMVVCKRCSLGFIYPEIDEENLNNFYENFYWLNRFESEKKIGNFEKKENFQIFNLIKNYISVDKKYNILEFGMGNGNFAKYISTKMKIKKYSGIEANNKLVNKINLSDQVDDFLILDNIKNVDNNGIDLIFSIQSIEHVNNLEKFMETVKSKLSRNGLLYIETPNCNWDYFTRYKKGFFPHTYFLNKKVMEQISKKFNLKILINEDFDELWSNMIKIRKIPNEEGHNLRTLFINN